MIINFCLSVYVMCRCNDGKADLTQVFELSELGRGQAFLHLRQVHERAYDEFLHRLPAVQSGALLNLRGEAGDLLLGALSPTPSSSQHPHHRAHAALHTSGSASSDDHALVQTHAEPGGGAHDRSGGGGGGNDGNVTDRADASLEQPSSAELENNSHTRDENATRSMQQRVAEANRSRLRRLKASSAERHVEAVRSKKRRENLTPVQRQADYDRRKRKKKRQEESVRSRKRREQASDESREKEQLRSRERRRNATEDQKKREAERSKRRRENASEEQRLKERERCRMRYETKKNRKGGSQYSSNNSSGNLSDDGSHSSMSASDYDHYSHRHQRHYDDNSIRQHEQQRHDYYHQEEFQQQQHSYDLSRPLNGAVARQPGQQQQTSFPDSNLPPATATGTPHVFQVPPIDSIRVPPPPSSLNHQGRDDIRLSFSNSSGFRFFSSPSPSALDPGTSFASISGTARTPPVTSSTTNNPASAFRSGGLLSLYPQQLSMSPIVRSNSGGASRLLGTANSGIDNNSYSPATSSQPQLALPHLPTSLHALSQSLQPLPSATSTQSRTPLASRAISATTANGSQTTPSAHATTAERGLNTDTNLAFA